MPAVIPILQIALAALPMIQVGVAEFIAWLETLKVAAKQNGEWAPEIDAAYRAGLFAKTNDPAYQPDKP